MLISVTFCAIHFVLMDEYTTVSDILVYLPIHHFDNPSLLSFCSRELVRAFFFFFFFRVCVCVISSTSANFVNSDGANGVIAQLSFNSDTMIYSIVRGIN